MPYRVTSIDVSDPLRPCEEWHRITSAKSITLAPDASSYAAVQPSSSRDGEWELAIVKDGDDHPFALLPLGATWLLEGVLLSAKSRFVAWGSFGSVRIADLRGNAPEIFPAGPPRAGVGSSSCLIALLELGYALLDEESVPRFDVYAPRPVNSRVATVEHRAVPLCGFRLAGYVGSSVLLSDWHERIIALDAAQPEHLRQVAQWVLPHNVRVVGADRFRHLYTVRNERDKGTVGIYDLSKTDPVVVDWQALDAAWKAALAVYGDAQKTEANRLEEASQMLDNAGASQAQDAVVKGIPNRRAAAIMNDYAFFRWKERPERQDDVGDLLRRAIALDPHRKVAYLNLADWLRESVPLISSWEKRVKVREDARGHYRKYLSLGGKDTPAIEAFLRNLDGPPVIDVCSAITRYANAGRLSELVATRTAVDIRVGKAKFDFVFTYEGTAHVPNVYTYNARDDSAPTPAQASSGDQGWDLWGGDSLGLVIYRTGVHILHYRDMEHPVRSKSLSSDEQCKFSIDTAEEAGTAVLEPVLCASLSAGTGPSDLVFDGPASMSREDVAKRYGETELIGTRTVDVGNDGVPVILGKLELTSGAGAGCEEFFFDALDPSGSAFASDAKEALVMGLQGITRAPWIRYPVKCGTSARLFQYQGMTYFEGKPARWPPEDAWNQYHRVTRVRDGKVEDACNFTFRTTVH